MGDITIQGPALPFVLGGKTTFTIHAGTLAIDKPLPRSVTAVFDVETAASANAPVSLGAPGTWTIAIKAQGSVKLAPVWPANGDPSLVFTVGASADGTFSGQFRYAALTASASLEASTDTTFSYSHPFSADLPLKDVVSSFFANLQLPATIGRPPAPGEVLKFEYGGYLNFAGGVSAGYELKGAPSMTVGQLLLSEHYDLSIVGKLGFTGQVGGFFSVEMRPGADAHGNPLPAGWTRVIVQKTRAAEFGFAADASVGITSALQGLPDTPNDFLGALLGVNAKNWLNLLEDVKDLTTVQGIQDKLDGLAMDYLVKLVGKAANDPAFLPAVLSQAKKIADDYNNIDNTVVSAFDKYYDQITSPALGPKIGDAIGKVAHLQSWGDLKGDVDPTVWSLVNDLTGGDPLGWIAGKAVGELQKKAQDLLALGSGAAHTEIRSAIALAKSTFGLTPLFAELEKIGTVDALKAEGSTALGAFVQRLLGDDIQKLNNSQLVMLLTRVHKALDAASTFEAAVYAKIKDAVAQSLNVKVHAEYSQASDHEALIDININASTPEGLALLRAAGRGDFEQALASYRPDLVRLNSGRLTHNLVSESAVNIDVVGWHAGWHFQGVEKLLLGADQQIVPEEGGGLTIYTTIDLTTERDRKTTHDETFTNLLLRFLGESRGVLDRDDNNVEYLIDAITSMSAEYQLGFNDDRTSGKHLAYDLGFASDFGLKGAQVAAVEALLPLQSADNFGPVSVTYNVAYTSDGLRRLFGTPLNETVIRVVMRKVVLANYLRVGGSMAAVGWAYWTPGVRTLWERTRPAFAMPNDRQFNIAVSPFASMQNPPNVVLSFQMQADVDVLYQIEDAFTNGLLKLEGLIAAGVKMSPHAFENALGDIGRALQLLTTFGESPNTTFAVLDSLLTATGGADRASSLTLQSKVTGKQVTKIFLA